MRLLLRLLLLVDLVQELERLGVLRVGRLEPREPLLKRGVVCALGLVLAAPERRKHRGEQRPVGEVGHVPKRVPTPPPLGKLVRLGIQLRAELLLALGEHDLVD